MCYRLLNDRRGLIGGGYDLAVDRDVPKQGDRIILLQVVAPALCGRDAAGYGQNRGVVLTGFVESGNEMVCARTGGAATDSEPSGDLRLTGCGERGTLFVSDAYPTDGVLPANRVREWIEGVPDDAEHVMSSDLVKRGNEKFGDCQGHGDFSGMERTQGWSGAQRPPAVAETGGRRVRECSKAIEVMVPG